MMTEKAKRTGLFIIGGSHPVPVGDELRNVSHLFTPSGNVYTQEKLHITPSERENWGLQPGEHLKLFDTGLARIGIQVCYDIEFPEPSRLLTLAGAEIIFVPFSTDERRAYQRIRFCAAGRAIENMVYVALTGNVGQPAAGRELPDQLRPGGGVHAERLCVSEFGDRGGGGPERRDGDHRGPGPRGA
jgi:predicted amidohydrolase